MVKTNSAIIFATALTVGTMLVYTQLLPHSARANLNPYPPPCENSDIEFNSGCCPDNTARVVHNMCLTQDEIDERNERSGNFVKCELGQVLARDPLGALTCINVLTGQ